MNLFIDSGAGGGGGAVTDDLVFELDAGNSDSWGGSSPWANTVAAPSDGSGQTAYDYNPGGGGNSPTFTGSVGSPSAYWDFDGNDFFTLAGSSTAFLQDMHKTGAQWTVELWLQTATADGSNVAPMFDTGTSDQGGGDTSRGVIYMDMGALNAGYDEHGVRVKRDSSGADALSVKADSLLSAATVYMLAASIDGTGALNSFLYRNGAYDPVSAANTWDGTYSTPGSTSPANTPRLGTRGDATSGFVPNGARLHLVRVYQRNLTKSELDQNWNATRSRYGL